MKFSLAEAHEHQDLVAKKNVLTANWAIDDVDQAPIVVDVLGRRFLVTRVSAVVDQEGKHLLLCGLRCSSVNDKVLGNDNFLTSPIDLSDHVRSMRDLGIELDSFRSHRHGRVDLDFFV